MSMMLKNYATLNYHGVMGIIDQARHSLTQDRLGGDTPSIHYQQSAIVLYEKPNADGSARNDEPIAIMVYKVHTDENMLFIYLSYVRPPWRRRGCYNQMWDFVLGVAKKANVARIISVTDPKNYRMQEIYAKLGRRPTAITYEVDPFILTERDAAKILAVKSLSTKDENGDDIPF